MARRVMWSSRMQYPEDMFSPRGSSSYPEDTFSPRGSSSYPEDTFSPRGSLAQLADTDLARVIGGETAASSNNAFGRCGPGTQWKFLGDVYTPQCAAHDAAVRGALQQGSSPVMAHAKALPLLPAAIGSYVGARLAK